MSKAYVSEMILPVEVSVPVFSMYIMYSIVSPGHIAMGIVPVSRLRRLYCAFEVVTIGFVTVSDCVSDNEYSGRVTVIMGLPPFLSA